MAAEFINLVMSSIKKKVAAYSTVAQAAIDKYTGLSVTEKDAISVLVDAIDGRGDWVKINYFLLMNLGTQANSLIDSKGGLTAALIETGGKPVTWTQFVGFKGDADNSGIDTLFDSSSGGMLLDDAGYGVYVVTANTSAGDGNYLIHSTDNFINDRETAANVQWRNHSVTSQTKGSFNLIDGNLYTIQRTGAAVSALLTGGASTDTSTNVSSSMSASDIRLLSKIDGTSNSNAEISAAIFGEGSIDWGALETDIETFNSSLTSSSYSTEAQAAIDNMASPPPSWLQEGMSVLVDDAVSAGEWEKVKYILAGNMDTENNSLSDWIGGGLATKVSDPNPPVWTQYIGWKFNEDGAINSGYNPFGDSGLLLNDVSYHVKIVSVSGGTPGTGNSIFGAEDGTDRVRCENDTDLSPPQVSYQVHTNAGGSGVMTLLAGDLLTISRSTSVSHKLSQNTSTIIDATRTSTAKPNQPIYIGSENNDGSIDSGRNGLFEFNYFIVSEGNSDISGWISRLNTLINTVSANISTDVTNPTPPVMGASTSITSTSAVINISTPGTDNIGVVGYDWYTTQRGLEGSTSAVTQFINLGGLSPSTSYDAYALSRDAAGNVSAVPTKDTFSTTASSGLSITIDFETDPTNPPLKVTGPNSPYTAVNPTDSGKRVSEHSMEIFDGTTVNTNYTSRREYEYNGGAVTGEPPRYSPWFTENSLRWKFYLYPDHKGSSGNLWDAFQQLHNWAGEPQTGGPPLVVQTQDNDGNGVHDVRFKVRWNETIDSNVGIQEAFPSATSVFNLSTWYYVVLDYRADYRNSGNGYAKLYVKTGTWPSSSGDIVIDYSGPIGFNSSSGWTVFPQLGMYWADTRFASRVATLWSAGITKKHWALDDWTHQNSKFI